MKLPRYFVETAQQQADCRINPFALALLAESFADDPQKFGDENVLLLAQAHNGHAVWFIMSKTKPTAADFDPEGAIDLRTALAKSLKLQSHYATLLNSLDGGERMTFASVEAWLARLYELEQQKARLQQQPPV